MKLGFRGHLVFRILKLGFILTLLFIFMPTHIANAGIIGKPPANLGLVGYWSMNENTGTIAGDSSGNNNRGILTNGPTWVDGKRGKALNFDGSNDYVDAGGGSALNFTGSFSISAWIYPRSFGGGSRGRIVDRDTGSLGYMFFVDNAGGANSTNGLSMIRNAAGSNNFVGSNNSINLNRWQHVVGTYNSSGNVVSMYVNGAAVTTFDSWTGPPSSASVNLRIGNSPATATREFNGLIDEVRIYNRALSAAEIQALYKSGAAKIKFPAVTRTSLTSGYDNAPAGTCTTASITPTSNALVLLAVFHNNGADPAVSGNGLTWVKIDRQNRSGGNGNVTIYRALGAFPTAGAITITTGASRCAWSVVEYTGVDTSGANGSGAIVQAVKGQNGFSGSLALTLAAFSSTYNVTYGALFLDNDCNSMGITPGSGFTQIHKTSGSTSNCGQTQDQLANDTTVDWTHTNAWNAGIALEIKAKPRTSKINASQNSKLTNGLVGMWSFNGPDLTTTTAYDRSGQGNNGTLTNGPSRVAGKVGQALNFDGVNDYINVGSGSSLDNLGPMTASAWIYAKSSGEGGLTGRIFDKCMTGGSNNCWIFYQTTGGVGGLTFYVDGSTILRRISSNGVIQYNKWHHVLVTWDGVITTAASVHIYVDGNEVTYTTTTNGASRTSDAIESLIIGNTIDSNRTWDGLIDEVRIYNRALSPDEVKRLYNMGR